jgi:hypothetical protein
VVGTRNEAIAEAIRNHLSAMTKRTAVHAWRCGRRPNVLRLGGTHAPRRTWPEHLSNAQCRLYVS